LNGLHKHALRWLGWLADMHLTKPAEFTFSPVVQFRMDRMVLQHPRVLQLKGRGKPKLAFLGGASSPKRLADPDMVMECRKRIKASLWDRQCDAFPEGSVPPNEGSSEITLSHEEGSGTANDNPSAFQEAFLDALVEDRASLINENLQLKKRITELTAQVLALQLYMKGK
jgi:hypothetical protein